jgi:FSR family fosmidomycin resistance protein-like MFS transporter
MKYRSITTLSVAHLITDINQGAVPALLPFLIAAQGLTYTAAATIVFATNISSSLVQPLFGHFSDRISKAWLMPSGILLAGVGLAFTGVAPSYRFLLGAAAVSGIGVAAFHPEAARLVNELSGKQKAMGISLFAIGGQFGMAIGPMLTTLIVVFFGLTGTLLLAAPVTIMCVISAWQYQKLFHDHSQPSVTPDTFQTTTGDDAWFPFLRLTVAVLFRSFTFYGLNTFLALYWIHVLHQSKIAGGTALTLFLSFGVLGTLLGGRMGDRYGYRRVALIGFCFSSVLLPVFVLAQNVRAATLLLIPLGIAHCTAFSPMVVLGQKYLPNRIGLASGVTLGLSVSVGGVAAPVLGRVADGYGIHAALMVLAFFPLVAGLFMLTLPRRHPLTDPVLGGTGGGVLE